MRLARILAPAVVAVLCFVAFLPSLDGKFLGWDDSINLVSNLGYRGLGWPQVKWAFTATLMGHWIPLTWLSFGLNYVLGGMNPWGYHLGNLLLHAANGVLFYFAARRLLAAAGNGGDQTRRCGLTLPLAATLAALLFGVHPLRTESVAWITERRDVLCGLFFLLSTLAYLRGVQAGSAIRPGWGALSLAAFAAALMSKAAAMPLPIALLVLDIYPLRRTGLGWTRLVLEKVPWMLLSAVAAAVALFALPRGGLVTPYSWYGPVKRVAMVAYSLAFYPRKFFWPSDLSPLYELPVQMNPFEWRFVGSFVAVVGITLVLWLLRRCWPSGLAAWAYSAIMIMPVSGVIHSGHQLAHDRYSYLSGLGFGLLLGGGFLAVMRLRESGRVSRLIPGVVGVAGCVAIAALAVGSWSQSHIWRDSESLWRWAVEVEPSCAICRLNLGAAVLKEDPTLAMARLEEAEALFREAIRLRPTYGEAYFNLSLVLMMQGRFEEAERGVRLLMDNRLGGALVPEFLGLLYLVQGRYAEAVPPLREAATMRGDLLSGPPPGAKPEDPLGEALGLLKSEPDVLTMVGQKLLEAGKPDRAVQVLQRALALDHTSAKIRYWLVRAYFASGATAEGQRELQALRVISPELAAKALDMPPFGR
jgi:tetratricopeptide (TPR) repeat protein